MKTEIGVKRIMNAQNTIELNIEYTDTFNGESNYSWVKRTSIEIPSDMSDLGVVRLAKKSMGLNGIRCKKISSCNGFSLYPFGMCTVLHIDFNY